MFGTVENVARSNPSDVVRDRASGASSLPPEVVRSILLHLSLPPLTSSSAHTDTPQLPLPSLDFLSKYTMDIPPSLLVHFADVTTPKERSKIKTIKARRMRWANAEPDTNAPVMGSGASSSKMRNGSKLVRGEMGPARRRPELTAREGWIRWPLLWEKMGGDPLGPPPGLVDSGEDSDRDRHGVGLTERTKEERRWTERHFPPSRIAAGNTTNEPQYKDPPDVHSSTAPPAHSGPTPISKAASKAKSKPNKVTTNSNRLASFLSTLESDREASDQRAAKRREREADREAAEQAEEFDSESDEEDGGEGAPGGVTKGAGGNEVVEGGEVVVVKAFERRLLELFLDGEDTLDYTPIDFPLDPPSPEGLTVRDLEDAYFYEQGVGETEGREERAEGGLDEGEYDY